MPKRIYPFPLFHALAASGVLGAAINCIFVAIVQQSFMLDMSDGEVASCGFKIRPEHGGGFYFPTFATSTI